MNKRIRTAAAPGRPARALGALLASVLTACGPGGTAQPPRAPAIPAIASSTAAGHLDQAAAPATYSVINLAPGNLIGVPAINAGDQVAMSVENATGVRAYFFNGQTVRDIGTLGGPSAHVAALNNAAQVTGWAAVDIDTVHAFRWSQAGGMRDLSPGAAGNSFGMDINQHGQVAGHVEVGAGPVDRFAFRWDARQGMLNLGVLPGETTSLATAINDRGMVSGFTDNRAFACTPSQGMFAIGFGIPQFINNAGQVAGYVESPRLSPEVFVWNAAMGFETLGTLGGSQSQPFGMNAAGQVVGMSDTADPSGLEVHAFSWTRRAGMQDLGVLGGLYSSAQAVNDSGQVVGLSSYRADSDLPHAFHWTRAQGMRDLNRFIPGAPAGLELRAAWAISPGGAIVAESNAGLVLLKPGAAGTDAPVLGPIVAGADPIPVGAPVTFTASFSDQNRAERHRATWHWGGGCSSRPGSISEAHGKGVVTGTRTWCASGTYWITLTVTDSSARSATVARQVTVGVPGA